MWTRRVFIHSRRSGTLSQSELSPAADMRTAHPDRDNEEARQSAIAAELYSR